MTIFNFFKVGNHYEYIKEGKLVMLSAEMFACLLNQYRMMDYEVVFNNDCFISVAKYY